MGNNAKSSVDNICVPDTLKGEMNDVSLKIKIRNNNQKTGEQLTFFPILNLKSLLAFTDDVSAVANETGVRQNT
jgi:hypothetical protein